jgi:hypothetical protein
LAQYDCQNLTETITILSGLSARIVSVCGEFEPADGVTAREEAQKIIESLELLLLLGGENLAVLAERLGGTEELKKRINPVKIGGLKDREPATFLSSATVPYAFDTGIIVKTSNMRAYQTEHELMTIFLSARELGFDAGTSEYTVYNRADEMGFQTCPFDVAFRFRPKDGGTVEADKLCMIAMYPLKNLEDRPCVFLQRNGRVDNTIHDTRISESDLDTAILFQIVKKQR